MSGYISRKVSKFANENIYYFETENDCVVIDPGYGAEEIFSENMKGKKITVLMTHGHFDHMGGLQKFIEQDGATVYIGEEDKGTLLSSEVNNSKYRGMPVEFSAYQDKIKTLKGGEVLSFGNHTFKTYKIQGHTQGGIFFIDDDAKIIITGDSLQKGTIGLTNIPGVRITELKENLAKFLKNTPRDYVILPGHTDPSTIGEEIDTNEWLK